MAEITVSRIAIITETGAKEYITVKDFMLKAINERTMLILKKQVEFYDAEGKMLAPLDAVRTLTHTA